MKKKKIIKLFVGSNNQGKIKEIRDLLPKKLKILTEKIEYNFQLLNQKILESVNIYEMISRCHDDENIFVENSKMHKMFEDVLPQLEDYTTEVL